MMANEIIELIHRAQNKDEQAMDECVRRNTGLVWSLVHRFHYSRQEPQELFQAGCVGLMKAILNYDSSYEVMFSTYAVPMILGEIKKYFRDDGSMRVSRSIKERYIQILKCKESLQQSLNEEVTLQQIANELECDLSDVIIAMEANQYLLSMDEPYYQKDGSEIRLEDKVESPQTDMISLISLRQEMKELSARETHILYLRYEVGLNQSDIAKKMGMTQVQISRTEKKIIEKLRAKLVSD